MSKLKTDLLNAAEAREVEGLKEASVLLRRAHGKIEDLEKSWDDLNQKLDVMRKEKAEEKRAMSLATSESAIIERDYWKKAFREAEGRAAMAELRLAHIGTITKESA